MKTCKSCSILKSFSEFRYHKDNRDHLTGKCKTCLLQDRKARQAEHFNPVVRTKICVRCKEEKTTNHFVFNKSCKDGFNGWCRACGKDAALQAKYGLSLEAYQQMLDKQDHRCALCGTPDPKGPTNEFVVDHCHITGKVRGLLCNHCNTGLGKLKDSSTLLRKAADYIDSVL